MMLWQKAIIAACVTGVFLSLMNLIRNQWVYRVRTDIAAADYEAYRTLPSYSTMMAKWWIWDAAKFFGMPDPVDDREAKSVRRGQAIIARTDRTPSHD